MPTFVRKGTEVLVPYRQLHFDDRTFGKAPEYFDSDCFLDKNDLSRSSNFRPFGGGTTYCPGRFVAKREVLTFVALVLERFDVVVAEQENGGTAPFPQIEDGRPAWELWGRGWIGIQCWR